MSSTKNMIAGRYEVVQHIGQGGMADVFLAVDTILNRQVAVKILRADLSTDTVSILRFEREAQAATALSHPNIVEIYDVGDYKGHHYIVMEYVPGRTLKQIIRERGPLMNEEAVDIMKQLTSAISEAHKRGIIHRDIKPQNIIVKSDGSIKILDFGIATAKGSVQLTQANNVMGSVHYLAPELARGQQASPQSDIYAMGIVMFEMLAGDVPFKADQAVQIALMHMRDPLPNIRAINPAVPQSVANIINKAAAKNPADRYASAADMLADLNTCLNPERINEPARRNPAYSDTALLKAQRFEEDRPAYDDDDDETDEDLEYTAERKARLKKERAERRAARKKQPKKKHTGRKILIAVLILALLAGTGLFLYRSGIGRTVTVPDLTGMTIDDALTACEEVHLVLDTDVTYELSEDVEEDLIISSDPSEGTSVKRGSTVTVVVSSGVGVRMADYTGQNVETAVKALSTYTNLTVKTVAEDDDSVDAGTVLRQEGIAAGELFDPDEANTITLYYASYPSGTIPSDIIGKDYNEAASELENMGFEVFVSEIDASSLSEEELTSIRENNLVGTVAYSDPAAGSSYTQTADSYITLYYYSYADVEATATAEATSEATADAGTEEVS
jgi:serine/threonine-protein kinase